MQKFDWSFESKDGLKLFARGWTPEGKPKGVIALIHGLGEHTGRYEHVAAAFVENNYAMLGFDLRGHGMSGGKRGHSPSVEIMLQDIDLFLEQVEKRYPGLPVTIYGHSLGAVLVLDYELTRNAKIAGLIVTAPALHSSIELQKGKVFLARVLGALLPGMTMPSGLDAKMLSRDENIVTTYINDPLVHGMLSLGLGKDLIKVNPWILANAKNLKHRLLIMHGEKDQIGYQSSSIEFAAQAPKNLVTLKIWEGCMHEIHNELVKEQVIKFMLDWLKQAPAG